MHKICNKEENFFATLTDNRLILSVSAEAKKLLLFCSSAKVKFLFCFVEPFVLKVVFELEELYCFFLLVFYLRKIWCWGGDYEFSGSFAHASFCLGLFNTARQACLFENPSKPRIKIHEKTAIMDVRRGSFDFCDDNNTSFPLECYSQSLFHFHAFSSPFFSPKCLKFAAAVATKISSQMHKIQSTFSLKKNFWVSLNCSVTGHHALFNKAAVANFFGPKN